MKQRVTVGLAIGLVLGVIGTAVLPIQGEGFKKPSEVVIVNTPSASACSSQLKCGRLVPMQILSVGDSISEGPADASYRHKLGELLDAAGVSYNFTVAAHGGWRCSDWIPSIGAITAQTQPDLVIVSCGTNDAANSVTGSSMENTYRQLLAAIINAWPTTRVLTSWIQYSARRPPVPSYLPGAEAVVNDAIYRATINSIYGNRLLWPPADFQQIPEIYFDAGGIHPTAGGYEAMAVIIYNKLQSDPAYPWPSLTTVLCGMNGGRPGYINTQYLPCTGLGTA